MSNFKAVLFDMDGTLVDTSLHWITAYQKFIEKFNVPYVREDVKLVDGKSLKESSQIFKDLYNLPHSVEEILEHKLLTSDEIYKVHALPLAGATDLLKQIKIQNDKKTAVASGASLNRIETIVNRFGWNDYFHTLASTDHVNYVGKPDPAVFLYAAEALGVPPEQCVVIEDSENGLRAAKKAGMQCVIRHDDRWSIGNYSAADLIVKSLEDKDIYNFLGVKYEA